MSRRCCSRKLGRKRVGYDVPRYGTPIPYPPESVAGPMMAITNQFAGSDGDIFSHCFKLYKLGPLVGKRTWGGVIGINPYHHLVDGTLTTQPEYSFWFSDVGWKVENYGTDPDYDVDFAPQDYRDGRDPQMDFALRMMDRRARVHDRTAPGSFDPPVVAFTDVGVTLSSEVALCHPERTVFVILSVGAKRRSRRTGFTSVARDLDDRALSWDRGRAGAHRWRRLLN